MRQPGKRADDLNKDLSADAERLAQEVLEGNLKLVELRNTNEELDAEWVTAQGLSRTMLETLREIETELATFDDETLARRENIRQLQSDLKTLEEESKRLSAQAPSEETPGDRTRTFAGDGDRQYVTGLRVGGERVLILVDTSASMLDRRLVNILRTRNMHDASKRKARKWRQAVASVDWLTTQLPSTSRFQIYGFNESVEPLVEGTKGTWLDASSRESLDKAVASLRQTVPGGGTNLVRAFEAIRTLSPAPDNVILLTDGLPTQGKKPSRARVNGRARVRLFQEAVSVLDRSVPLNVLLFPMEGDPQASALFWQLAIRTRGALITPSRDWP